MILEAWVDSLPKCTTPSFLKDGMKCIIYAFDLAAEPFNAHDLIKCDANVTIARPGELEQMIWPELASARVSDSAMNQRVADFNKGSINRQAPSGLHVAIELLN
jgi:hypothetical protein